MLDFFKKMKGKAKPVEKEVGENIAPSSPPRPSRPVKPSRPNPIGSKAKDSQSQKKSDSASQSPKRKALKASHVPVAKDQVVTSSPQGRPKIISKSEDIPHHISVISGDGGALELPKEWQKDYVILLMSREKKEVEIVCSTEVMRKVINDDFLTIVDQIKSAGYVRTYKWNAKPEMIQIIYESILSKKNQEEEDRTATKIQIEFDNLIRDALAQDSSDVHIEVRRSDAKVRLRRNGDLFEHVQWPVSHARTMAGVIYMVIADEKDTTFDEMKPQDAIIDRDLGEEGRIRIRLATIPAYPSGFDMIMRILKMGVSGERKSLESLGYNKVQLANTRRAVAKPVGAVTMAGTTGSGKSTSLNSMMGEKIEIYKGKIKVITVEDPPEYLLKNSTQVPVVRSRSKAQAGGGPVNPFSAVVRAAMRSDPDILMVGEVRDSDSAELLIHAVQSGHQVFTTIHASSAIDIVARMRSNGVPDDVLGSQNFFSALMYQTLLPIICGHCSTGIREFAKTVSNEQDFELLQRILKYLSPTDANKLRFRHEEGCPKCEKGVVGRSVAAEVILPDPHMLQCFRERRDSDALLHYRHKGGKIALEHGLFKALSGLSDIRDVEHKLDQMTLLDELNYAVQVHIEPASASTRIPYSILMSSLDGDDDIIGADDKEEKERFMKEFYSFIGDKDGAIDEAGKAGSLKSVAGSDYPSGAVFEKRKKEKDLAKDSGISTKVTVTNTNKLGENSAKTVKPDDFSNESEFFARADISSKSTTETIEPKAGKALDRKSNGANDGAKPSRPATNTNDEPTRVVANHVVNEDVVKPAVDPIKTDLVKDASSIKTIPESTPKLNSDPIVDTAVDSLSGAVADEHVVNLVLNAAFDLSKPDFADIPNTDSDADSDDSLSGSGDGVLEGLFDDSLNDPLDDILDNLSGDLLAESDSDNANIAEDVAKEAVSTTETEADAGVFVKTEKHALNRLGNIIKLLIEDELIRNGLSLTPRFLYSRSSEASIKSIISNNLAEPSVLNELQEIISCEKTMSTLKKMRPDEFFNIMNDANDDDSQKKPSVEDNNNKPLLSDSDGLVFRIGQKDIPTSHSKDLNYEGNPPEARVQGFKSRLLSSSDDDNSNKRRAVVKSIDEARNAKKQDDETSDSQE